MENTSTGSPASAHERRWLNTSLSPDERAALLLAQMTLEEKVGMVHGKSSEAYAMIPISRLGIPALAMYVGASSRDIHLTGTLHIHDAEKKDSRKQMN